MKNYIKIVFVLTLGISFLIFIEYNYRIAEKFGKENESVAGFENSVKKFVSLYNHRDVKAYKYTFPYFQFRFTRAAARQKLDKKKYKNLYGRNEKEFRQKSLSFAKQSVDFFQAFRQRTTKYKIISINKDKLISKLLAKIPTKNKSNNELFFRSREITVNWFEHRNNYYIYEGLVHNTSEGIILKNDFIFDTASGPMDHLKKRLGKENFEKIKKIYQETESE